MGLSLDFNYFPVPSVIIDFNKGELYTNEAFVSNFDMDVKGFDELEHVLKTTLNYKTQPDRQISVFGLLKTHTEEISLQLTFKPIEKNQALLVLSPVRFNLEHLVNNKNFQSIYSSVPLGIIILSNEDNRTIFVSEYLSQRLGYSKEELMQKSWLELTYKDDIPKQEAILIEMIDNDSNTVTFEKRVISKSGKVYWFSEYIRSFVSSAKKYQVIVLRDINHEKETEAELQRAKQLVEDAERLKSAFLDNMPHEIRTPLHAITGFTSLLSDEDLTHEERIEYVKFIQDSSNDILNLMDNIIEIAKLETNQIKPKKEKCYVNKIIDKLHVDLRAKQNILEKENLEIHTVKDQEDPMFVIISDPERIYQILSHLLNNALKFTEKGFIEYGYRLLPGHEVEFFVKDTGVGIDPEEKNIIFKKFGKSGNINTNKNRGSGLGLTLSKKLVELLKGEINFHSEKGKGSTFTFVIPNESEQKISITKPSVSGEINWSDKTILIAEDTESNYYFIEAFLERTRVNLIWAKDGLEATEIFKTQTIDLVLMDIMMPEMDGYDATKIMKEFNPDIPVIAQTALALPDDEEKCYEVGCEYVLIKPINSEDLIASIKRFI